jgi:hypothetical protein
VAALLLIALGSAPGSGQLAIPTSLHLGLVTSESAAMVGATASGVRVVKILADWSEIEPQRGRFSWAALDQAVATATREGLTPVVVLAHTPRWASIGSGAELRQPEIYTRQPPRAVGTWEQFVGAAAERYRGRVGEWQVWTQLGLPQFRGTGAEYLALLHTARTRIRAADARARVAMAAPAGMDLAFLLRILQEAPGAFDAVALAPRGFAPEALLRPLAILGSRLQAAGKALWLEWHAHDAMPGQQADGLWARLLAIAQVTGIERVFVADQAHVSPGLRQAAATLLGRPVAGYLVREPDVYAVVLGTPADPTVVAWATADSRALEIPASPPSRVTTIAGHPVATSLRAGLTVVPLGLAPVVVTGVASGIVDESRATAAARGPMLPVVGPDRDYSRASEVTARLGKIGDERGLYNLPYRTRRNGAVEAIEIGGVEAVRTSVARQVVYVYFDIDDTFLFFGEGRVPLEIVVEVWGARARGQVGFNLLYDSVSGYRFTPWQWVDVADGWVTHAIRLTDASMANTWGWDFAINAAGNRAEDLVVRTVTVRKISAP